MRPKPGLLDKGCAALIAVLIAIATLIFLPNAFWKMVASDEKRYRKGFLRFGYTIETPWGWRNAYRITLYGDQFSIQLAGDRRELRNIPERRWLCQDRILYLNLDVLADQDTAQSAERTKLIYDFERGEIYSYDGPWIVDAPEGSSRRYTTEQQFSEVLQGLERNCHR